MVANCGSNAFEIAQSVCANIYVSGTFEFQTQDRCHSRTERILQVEEQILERDQKEPDISTRRLAAEVGVS